MEYAGPVREALLPYGKQWLDEEDIEAVVQVLRGELITQGPAIERFERRVAEYAGVRYAVAFCNGTAALHGACFAAGIGDDDEVITTPITFIASSNCVLYMGGKPVFADILPDTYNINPAEVERLITSRTKAIIPVDFTGQPVDMDRINELARKNNLVVIHDAAHSLGASYAGKKVGSLAHMTMFSFHPVKHVTSGEGGMIVTDDEHYYKRLLLFRNHGMTRDAAVMQKNDGPWYYEMSELGYNYRMTDIQAALGHSQMGKLDHFVDRRREIAGAYNEALSGLDGLVLPFQHEKSDSSWHLYMIRFEQGKFTADRREIFEAFRENNIGVNVHYIPVYHQPFYKNKVNEVVHCPEAETYYQTCITLPLFPRMNEHDVADVITAVLKIYKQYYSGI
ncbi:UDP-4-amino-4,6-dideoxy-N-acetyl-beta-L-altrosamine transaminase [Paenibacillus sp. FSL H8-0537]|uniref:UDP-4-amino-4, 6-dideoxy-N-acetyl-beta-L-altrosamine transaminase n=1 Tax=Paenibacillus sp. FSL H8-0537 TaxID=2921399 RepID=UPI0031012453